MNRKSFSWMSPAIGVGTSSILAGQRGVMAVAPIKSGEVTMVMGGPVVDIPTHNRIGSFGEEYGIDCSQFQPFLRRRFYDLHPGWVEAAALELPCAVEISGPLPKAMELARRAYQAQHPRFAAE